MTRWIAFDQQTSSLLRTHLAQGTTIETFASGAVAYALAKPGAVVTLLPAMGSSGVGIAVFRPPVTRRKPNQSAPLPVNAFFSTRAGGFLGLRDEVVLEDEPEQEKKGWWRRFWDE
jgi:hypothetical protein